MSFPACPNQYLEESRKEKRQEVIEQLQARLKLSQRVTRRNVVRIYDLGEGDGAKFITMEFIEGQDLRSDLRAQGPGCARSRPMMFCGFRSRWITSTRCEWTSGWRATLEGDGMTQTGALVGTMEYMSPEQALTKELDPRSNIISAGLIFYELLTGQMPFRAESALASLIKRTQELARPSSEQAKTIPQSLGNIVGKCPEREPAARYSSASGSGGVADQFWTAKA